MPNKKNIYRSKHFPFTLFVSSSSSERLANYIIVFISQRKNKSWPYMTMTIDSIKRLITIILMMISCMALLVHADAVYTVITNVVIAGTLAWNAFTSKNKFDIISRLMLKGRGQVCFIHADTNTINHYRDAKRTDAFPDTKLKNLNTCL
jgi:hypothetical protein